MTIKKIYPVILILALGSGFDFTMHAGELISPQLGATYVKLTDGTKSISLTLSARIDDKRVNLENAPITVYAVNETEKILLGKVNTNRKGKAVLNVGPGSSLPKNKEGFFTFDIQYDGNQVVDKKSAMILVKDVFLEISFIEKDSVKNIVARVYAVGAKGGKEAVQEVPVEFYAKRIFCLYRFGGDKTDSSGYSHSEFPKNFPGDTIGNVVVVGKILENDIYGTVETVAGFTAGRPLFLEPKPKRGLGDTDAPLWMVYTLIVLLSGVWLHVLYVISLVIRINLMGKKALQQGR